VIDARKGEVFYAMYRQVPGGVQQVAEPTVGPVDDLVADLLARSQDVLCVGDGALRYRQEILDGYRCELGGDAHPSAAPLVQLAHARALREDWVNPWEIEPVYLRAPDALINWSTRAGR
jgi:tRNA threonylcarbamoyladenosine biosynthesis protein TsaB